MLYLEVKFTSNLGSLQSARKALLQFSQFLTELNPPKYRCIQKDPVGEGVTKSLYTVC